MKNKNLFNSINSIIILILIHNCKKKYLKMNEWKDEFINEWLKGWIKVIYMYMTEWKDESMKKRIDKWLNERINELINDWMEKLMN